MLPNSKSNVSEQIQQSTQMPFRVFVIIMYIKVKRPQTQTNIYNHRIITRYGSNEQSENDIKVNKLNGMNNDKWVKAQN